MSQSTIRDLLDLLERLKAAQIYYTLSDHTGNAVMVEVAVPGERWEIEIHADGQIGIEVFVSNGVIRDEKHLEDLFKRFSD
jgi:hypothetical protein